jgi:hypothetical protein
MRRNCRMILKWILFAGILAILFKLCCDSLVDIFLSVSSSSIVDMNDSDSDISYEDTLIAWAATGQRLNDKKFSMENIKERSDLQLIGGQIFFRHGARTPLNLLPSLEEVY